MAEYKIAEELSSIGESVTLKISAQAKQLIAQGKDVLNVSAGEPDYPMPQWVVEGIKDGLKKGKTTYTPASGVLELRKEIAQYYNHDHGTSVDEKNVIIGNGGKSICANAIRALVNPGDEVILIAPFWISYVPMITLAKAVPKIVYPEQPGPPRLEEIEKAITKRTKAVMINYPNNPTGELPSNKYIKELVEFFISKGIIVLSDEIYQELYFGEKPKSAIGYNNEMVLSLNGFSKSQAMTGLRMGFAVGPKELIGGMAKIQSHTDGCANSLCQYGLLGFNDHLDELNEARKLYKNRLEICKTMLKGTSLELDYTPNGAFYVFPKIKGELEANEYCDRLLNKALVAAVPGEEFGDAKRVRISYACSEQVLKAALERISNLEL